MAKDKRGQEVNPAIDQQATTVQPVAATVPLPAGLNELSHQEAALLDGWEKRANEDGAERWINRRDFQTRSGAVPQGVVRDLAEAYALEVQRLG